MSGFARALPGLLLLMAFLHAPAMAQEPAALYTQVQADRGKRVYEQDCAMCHGPREFSQATFMRRWSSLPLGALFAHIQNTMPQDAPGRLSSQQVADVVAYILQLNGHPAGDEALPADLASLGQIRLQNPSGAER
jgi:mono/diheme cytochrome c family protein